MDVACSKLKNFKSAEMIPDPELSRSRIILDPQTKKMQDTVSGSRLRGGTTSTLPGEKDKLALLKIRGYEEQTSLQPIPLF